MSQNFKGDPVELRFQESARPVLDRVRFDMDQFFSDGFNSSAWLLLLYDENRMPFSERIKREAFVDFIREALKNFPFSGTFDTYLFVLRAVFGELSEIFFEVPAPGKLAIDIDATSSLEFDFIGREFNGTSFDEFDMIDSEGNKLIFRGIAGIETPYELELLFSELMPAGIIPTITLSFFERSIFVAEDDLGNLDQVVDHDGNLIIFWEIGG